MEHSEILVVTAHKVYLCDTYDKFINKMKALRTLNIPFNFYYKVGGEWVNMSPAPKGIFDSANK